jgi:hypothetical protein
MKNFVIVFLLAVIVWLLLGKKSAEKLAIEAGQKLSAITSKVVTAIDPNSVDITGTQTQIGNANLYVAVTPVGVTPLVDNPVVAPVDSANLLSLSKDLVVSNDATPIYSYTPVTKKHGAFNI